MKILEWIARALLLSMIGIGAMIYFIAFLPVVIAFIAIAWNITGIRKILWGIVILLILALPLYWLISSYNYYGSIHVYDQPDIAALIVLIACIAGACGAILHIVIGSWQIRNKSLAI